MSVSVAQRNAVVSSLARRSPAGDLAAEDEGDDPAGHVLVDAGEGDGLDVEAGFLADLAAQPIVDGLAEFQDSAGWFPAVVVGPLGQQGAAVVVGDDRRRR